MFNNDSNTSLIMVGDPFRLSQDAVSAYKPATAAPFNHFDPRLVPRPQHSYYAHQQRTIEIIQLEEVPPPSRRERISLPASTSYASTSYASSSACSEEEEAAESYCSSEEASEEQTCSEDEEPAPARVSAHSFHTRMRRIEQWRDAYAKAVGAQLAPSPKRKCDASDEDDDTVSRSSKRSRQSSTAGSASTSIHSCSACDTWFPDRGSLHQHGLSPRTNEACRAAVEYDCEQ